MEREILRQIWPIFSAEAREHLDGISAGFLELERDPARAAVLDGLRRTAHSLKGSAGSLGLGDVETLAHAIEGSLAGFDPAAGLSRAAVQAALDAVEAIEDALAAGDGGAEPRIGPLEALLGALAAVPGSALPRSRPAPPEPPLEAGGADVASEWGGDGAAHGAPALGAEVVDPLDAAVEELCAPIEAEARRRVAEEASRRAREIAACAGGAAGALAARAADAFARLVEAGPEAPRATAALAGDLIDLRSALESPRPAAEAPRGPTVAAVQASGPAEKSIRVLASTLDSLARQLELLALADARHARRAREVGLAEGAVRETLRAVEGAAHALRVAGVEVARPELSDACVRLRAIATDLGRIGRDGHRDADGQRLAGTVLREDVRSLRMVPAAIVLEPLRRAVRDVAGKLGKEVDLVLEGGDVRLDRRVVDELKDPLLHLVRNAVDHGIEAPEARQASGKPARGRVAVRVEPRGGRVVIVVEDDGPGLDVSAVRSAAVRKGLVTAEAAEELSDREASRLVFSAGLSTARAVTSVSGRGVGLDVVKEVIERLGGSVDLRFARGQGTRFDLEVPLTLAATLGLVVRVGRDFAAIPADCVERVLLLGDRDVGTIAGAATVRVGGVVLPYAHLSRLLGVPAADGAARRRVALVLSQSGTRIAVGVDEVVGQQELVVVALGRRVAAVTHLAGAAVLDDGHVVGVLSPAEVIGRAQPSAAPRGGAAATRTRVLVADDSLTTRSAMKALLEMAGYAVVAAADGEEAFALLRESGAQLVVSDVQMPRLDGLGLTRRVKADPRLRATPVILVTSLDGAEDRAAGLDAGADGYVVKREVERGKLLELVRQLLPATA
jgi:two-component system chemotaxis sensor kinase CheA